MTGRKGKGEDDEDRIKFPFGHSVEGNLDEILASNPARGLDSDELPLLASESDIVPLHDSLDPDAEAMIHDDDDDSEVQPIVHPDSDELPVDDGSSDTMPLGSDVKRAAKAAPPLPPPARGKQVEYVSEEGPVPWAPRLGERAPVPSRRVPQAPSSAASDVADEDLEDEDEALEELTASEVGRIIDAQVDDAPPRQLFAPIPEDPARSKRLARESARAKRAPSQRAPSARTGAAPDPSARTSAAPAARSGRAAPPPADEVVRRSEVPTQSVDPAQVPLALPRPGTPSSEAPTQIIDDDESADLLPPPPATPSGRHPRATPASEAPTLHGDADRPPPPPATPSGRQLAAVAPRPPGTPSGRAPVAGAAPLHGSSGPATLHTHVPAGPAPRAPDAATQAPGYLRAGGAGVPLHRAADQPTQAPGYRVNDSVEAPGVPVILTPLSTSESGVPALPSDPDDGPPTASQVEALERTHPESGGTFPSLQESGDATAEEAPAARPGGAASIPFGLESAETGGPLVLDATSGVDFADDPSSLEGPRFASGRAARGPSSEATMDELGRRTAEVDVPDLAALGKKRRLFEDSDITPIPELPDLFGSSEGPVTGLLESQELTALPPTDSARQQPLSPSLRLVQLSVERVVGLWEGDTAWVLASLGGAIVGPILLFLGWEYYSLPNDARPGHALDVLLRPGGRMGLVFGIAGSALFLLNLTYVLRRRLGLLKKWVSLRVWLNVHFICGLTGGSLILAHSAMLANNDVARISALAIAVAIASGIFGRYVLSHLPRRRDGEGPDLSERENVAGRLVELRRQLRARLGRQPALRDVALSALATAAVTQVSGTGEDDETPAHEKPRGVLFIVPLVLSDIAAAIKWRAVVRKVRALERQSDDPQLKKLLNETLALARVQRLEQRMAQYDAVQDLMDTWRGVHFIVALIVIATMALHVTIVLRYGRLDWLG